MAIPNTMIIAEAYAQNPSNVCGVDCADLTLAMHYGRGQEPIAILKRPPLPPPQMFTGYSCLLNQLRPDIQAKLSCLCEAAATLPLQLQLYLVGGAVRDLLLNQDTSDLDLVVDQGTAADLTIALAGMAPDVEIQRHDRYFTAELRWPDGTVIDLVTARQETYAAAAAHPEVTPATLLADLKRRDFTINALALGLSGNQTGCLIDPFGGLADLEAGYLRTLHANSFYEDPTRLVRGARFAARFDFQLPEHCQIEATAAVQSLSRSIWQVDYGRQDDRLKHEWAALLATEYWQAAIKLLATWGGLTYLSCQAEGATVIQSCQRYRYWRQYWQRRSTNTYPDLAAVVQHCAPTVQAVLLPAVEFNCPPLIGLVSAVTQQLHNLEPAAIILLASRQARGVRWLCWQYLRYWRHIKPLLNGHDLAAMGYPRGPLYKEILSHLLAAQLDQQIEPTPEAAQQWVATHFPWPNQG